MNVFALTLGWPMILVAATVVCHPVCARDVGVAPPRVSVALRESTLASATILSRRAVVAEDTLPRDVRLIADGVVHSADNRSLPFIIVNKRTASVHVFGADGQVLGSTPALLGLALGDESVPGIGERKLSSIRPEERTTPAGRFMASMGKNLHGSDILWVSYESAISLHPVITGNAREQRAVRLASPSPLDNRISFGCINVSAEFFKMIVSAAFAGSNGVVYVLPETRPVSTFFASYGMATTEASRMLDTPSTELAAATPDLQMAGRR